MAFGGLMFALAFLFFLGTIDSEYAQPLIGLPLFLGASLAVVSAGFFARRPGLS
jgi:hypothetical protein